MRAYGVVMSDQNPAGITTSEAFRRRRLAAGLSIKELAAKASEAAGRPVYPKTLHRIEGGELRGAPNMATVRAVAAALGLTPLELLGTDVLGDLSVGDDCTQVSA